MHSLHNVKLDRAAILFILTITTVLSAACTQGSHAESAGGAAQTPRQGSTAPVPITVATAVQKPMPLELRVIGTVEASSTVAVRAQLTGELMSVTFKEGDDVKEGQVLFTLDRRPLDAALKQAEANLQRDLAQAVNADAQAARAAELAGRGIATREQVDTAKANADALQGTIAADRAALENASVQLQYATIKAPLSGRTGALMVHPGNLVRANDATSLVVINQLSPINVTFAVPEAQLGMLKRYLDQGQVHVEVQPPNDDSNPSEGRITFVDNSVDQTTGTIKVKGSFPNSDRRLWPGQFVNVVMTLATDPNAIVVPTAAVQAGPDGSYVYVVKDDKTVELRPIGVGRSSGNETIVAKGLKGGETVVTDGHLRLVPGSHIAVKTASSQAAE
jgi:multidrug efflux system membrane fusion protein